MRHVDEIVRTLRKHYTVDFFASAHDRDPFKVLVSCLISLRTKDEVTYPAAQRLFALADTPQKMMGLLQEVIEKAIYPAGFYRTKAARIREISELLFTKYGSRVPDTIEELLEFKGIGRKTANIVLVFGYGKPAIPVDVHVHQVSNRLGWVKTKTPDQTEQELVRHLPKKYWLVINELFVRHGQHVCVSVSPLCSKCQIREYCLRVGVARSR